MTKFGLKTRKIALSCGMWCKMRFDILNRLGVDHECDGRTDRQTDR